VSSKENEFPNRWPKRIYLQRDASCAEVDCPGPHDTTWCEDKINDTDVMYIRADLVRVK
jgi:hypothetical protein